MKKIISCMLLIFILFILTASSKFELDKNNEFRAVKKVGKFPKIFTSEIIKNKLLQDGIKTTDGYLLINYLDKKHNKPQIVKFDLTGKELWRKEFPNEFENQVIKNITVMRDEGFMCTVRTNVPKKNQNKKSTFKLYKCDKYGNILWSKDYDFNKQYINNINETETGDIILTGSIRNEFEDTKKNNSDIIITKINKDGEKLIEKTYGGSYDDSYYDTKYIENLGLIALIHTNSPDGTFSASKKNWIVSVVALFDLSFEIEWQKSFEYNLSFDEIYINNSEIYISTPKHDFDKEYYGFINLIKIDFNGSTDWVKKVELPRLKLANAEFKDKIIFIQNDKIFFINSDGEIVKEINPAAGQISKIICYDDYFLSISMNFTDIISLYGPLDGPVYKAEYVYTGYSYNGKLLWRKGFPLEN